MVLLMGVHPKVQAQAEEIEQLVLDVQKLLQLKGILSDLKKGYEILSGGYNTIKNISEGNFKLHQLFLNGLLEVSPTVKKYKRVADIISSQLRLVSEYKASLRAMKSSGQFSLDEIYYVTNVFTSLVTISLKNLDALSKVLTDGTLRMSDAERLSAIDDIYKSSSDQLTFLRHFSSQTMVLAIQRARENSDVKSMQSLYGIK